MVYSLSCANFGSAALQRNLTIFLLVPVKKKKSAGELNVGTWRSEGQGRSRNQREDFGLRPPGPFLKAEGKLRLWEGKLSVLPCESWASPSRTSKIPPTVGRTHNFLIHPKPTSVSR